MKLSKEKREFAEEFIKSSWEEYSSSRYLYFYADRENISEIRQYMANDIKSVRYQNKIVPEELANADDTWVNVSWNTLDIFTKYRRIAIQIAMQMKEKMSIDIIDAMAVDEREEFFGDIMSQIYLRDQLINQGVDPELVGFPEELPDDQKELDMFMEFSYKHVAAIEFETILELIKSRNEFDEKLYRRLVEDVIDIGVCIMRDYEDEDGEIITQYVDPQYFYCSYTLHNDFKDCDFQGEVKRLTLAECRNLTSEPSEQERLNEIEIALDVTAPTHSRYRHIRDKMGEYQDFDSPHLNVVYCQFLSGETEEYEIRTSKSGVKVFGNKSKGKNNKEFSTAYFDVAYEGYWIMGTDVYFGVKQLENTLRDPDDVKRCKLQYSIYVPEMKNMQINSIGRQAIPIIDSTNIAWFRLQNAILRANPKGVAYDLTSLESVPDGPSGMDPKENILTYMMTGNLAIRAVDEDGNYQRLPIQELKGGIGEEGKEYIEQILFGESMYRSLTGLNELVDGSTPNPKTLKSVAQQAAVGSNNAIKHVHDGVQMVELDLSKNIIQRIQDQAENGDIEFYAPAIGTNSVNFFKITKDHSMRSLGLKFVPKPSVEEEAKFQEALAIAMQTPEGGRAQITIAQKAALEQIDNKKYALMYLSYIVEKNMEEAERKQQEMLRLQAEENTKSALAAEEAKRQTSAQEHQQDMALEDKKGMWQYKIEELRVSGTVQKEQIGSEARDRESARMNETKIGIDQMKAEKEAEAKKEQEKKSVSGDS